MSLNLIQQFLTKSSFLRNENIICKIKYYLSKNNFLSSAESLRFGILFRNFNGNKNRDE